ncbi:MAG: hypothetical protein GC134_05300 [Proteobacteria bacterium]|nr:hypothetical protein [Pseudomonadota bacterium]
MHKVRLRFPHKLALAPAGWLSRISAIVVHGLLLAGLTLPFYGPLMAVICAGFILLVESTRRSPYARDAIRFGAERCILFSFYGLGMMALVPLLPQTHTPLWYWHLSCFVMGALAGHDLYAACHGRIGLFYLSHKRESLA